MEKIIIAAMTKWKQVIGKNNWLPWNIPEELKHFRTLTQGSTVIMGRKTYESINRPMPNRHNIVVSRSLLNIPLVDVCASLPEALQKAESYGKTIFIIGGSQIFKQALDDNVVDKMYISYLTKDYDGDTFFPVFNESDWVVEKREQHAEFEFVVYKSAR
ncbi:MAG TPA: dihydrofolate reductase [Candidatus Nanoarchaeia archaeon]|nr:dihydrofolate reductase [Candidatus Nanoarchaeia archaeon]